MTELRLNPDPINRSASFKVLGLSGNHALHTESRSQVGLGFSFYLFAATR